MNNINKTGANANSNSNIDDVPTEFIDDLDYYDLEEESFKALEDGDFETPQMNPDMFEDDFDVYNYFALFDQLFFEGKLGGVRLEWSKRMTLCAGIFSVRNSEPVIRLSEPILKFRSVKEIKETLIHEMIHAYLFIEHVDQSDDRTGHGVHFKTKMYEINKSMGLDITVFHSFHDEVDFHRKHIWRCEGKCRNVSPYFGWVKRAMNRPPGKYDKWWKDHESSCGGQFIKIQNEEIKPIDKKRGKSTSRNKTLDNFVKVKNKK